MKGRIAMHLAIFEMIMMSGPGMAGQSISREPTPEELERFRLKQERERIARLKAKGHSEFIIDGQPVWALNYKNAKRKISK